MPPAVSSAALTGTVEISVRRVSMVFATAAGPVHALSDVDLEIHRGEFVSLIGPSGCGKSTLLRLVADVLGPTAGSIAVRGGPPSRARLAREFGFVFQQPGLLLWRNALANVSLPLDVGGWGRRHSPPKSPTQLLELVGLRGFESAFPRQLSGGMQQRVAIARALVTGPPILLMDEPFGALDEITRDHLNQELLNIWQATGTTIIFVTHSIPEAVYLSNRVFVFSPRPGRVVEEVRIDLPSPRQPAMKDSPEFGRYTAAVRRALAGGG
jgi:NitT/TauT family transport system ATP-binding protein